MDLKKLLKNGEYQKVVDFLEKKEDKSVEDLIIIGIAHYNLENKNRAISYFKKVLSLDPNNIDALFNLAEVYLQIEKYPKAKEYALKLIKLTPSNWSVHDILASVYTFEGFFDKALDHLQNAISMAPENVRSKLKAKFNQLKDRVEKANNQKKIAFVCAKGLDNFIDDIIKGLSNEYWIQRWVVTNDKEIKAAVDWADIVWFEWANEVAIIGTNYDGIRNKKVILRLHGYESLRKDFLKQINWDMISNIIFVAKNVMETAISNQLILKDKPKHLIPNGINLTKYRYKKRKPGFNIAFLGHFNYKKNPMMAIQILKKLVDMDKRYKLYWAGTMQDERIWRYLNYILEKMNIRDHFIFEGWIEDTDKWLEDKDIFLSTSIHEGYGVAIMEAMAKGIKPVIHNFYVAEEFYPKDLIFNTVDEAVSMITSSEYSSKKYKEFVEKYSLNRQLENIRKVIGSFPVVRDVTDSSGMYIKNYRNRKNILLIVIDTARYDEGVILESYIKQTPLVKFANTFTSGSSTPFAMTGVFYGMYPKDFPGQVLSLTTVFKELGYRTFGHNGGNIYCSDVYGRYDINFDFFEEKFKGKQLKQIRNKTAPSFEIIIDKFLKWLKSSYTSAPAFAWLHFMDAHGKFYHLDYLPENLRVTADNILSSETFFKTKKITPQELNILKSIRKTALSEIAKGINYIIENLPENYLIVITSDHGQGFMEHGFYDHPGRVYDEILHIPFYIVTDDKTQIDKLKEKTNSLISLVDLPATILDIIGVIDAFGRGNSFLKNERKLVISEGFKNSSIEHHAPDRKGIHILSFRTKDWKYIIEGDSEFFFILKEDPAEKKPLSVPEEIKRYSVNYLKAETRGLLQWRTKISVVKKIINL